MNVTVGTFNLNNLFGRWNFYADIPESDEITDAPPTWLAPEASPPNAPDVRIVIEGNQTPTGIKWRTNPYTGKVVFKKEPAAVKKLADRIKAIDVDVLAVQEVESIEALEEFCREQKLVDYRHRVLVEGNDDRLIDVAVLSKYPLGPVTSWRHRTYKRRNERPVFSRDLLQVDVLSQSRRRVLFTLFNNHLKSKLARDDEERKEGNKRRRRQVATIVDILEEYPPLGPYIVVGDMNDGPDSNCLRALRNHGVVNALRDPDETGGPYPANDPTPPATKAWTHRFRGDGRTTYELFDHIWLSPDLAARQNGAWIHRRKKRGGDATDHDPPYISLKL